MGKYDALQQHLERSGAAHLTMTFAQVDRLVGLPPSAFKKPEWWANEDVRKTRHVQCRSWQAAGYKASADLGTKTATFSRD